jgi:hypothetical protein
LSQGVDIMSAMQHLSEWRACVCEELLPDLHKHQSKALADLSFACLAAGSCQSGLVAAAVPGQARTASNRRRIERTLANSRLQPHAIFQEIARFLADRLAGRPLILILDETHNGARLACLKLSLAYRARALPIAAVCYQRDRPPQPMPRLIARLLGRAAATLPKDADVTLLTDRGLSWPKVLDAAVKRGWHFVGRTVRTTRMRLHDGSEVTAADLVQRPGRRWTGRVRAFKKAGGRDVYVTAVWERDYREPWLLISDQARGPRAVWKYAKRFWTEELFRDEKSHGLQWRRSLIRKPARGNRLMVLMALATLLAVSLGTWILKTGRRRWLESGRRRVLSIFQLGFRWLRAVFFQGRVMPRGLHLYPS